MEEFVVDYEIIALSDSQIKALENKLDEYDTNFITYKIDGEIDIGICEGEQLIAGLSACMTAFKILYVSTVFVEEKYRRRGLGKN